MRRPSSASVTPWTDEYETSKRESWRRLSPGTGRKKMTLDSRATPLSCSPDNRHPDSNTNTTCMYLRLFLSTGKPLFGRRLGWYDFHEICVKCL
uniref:Uncharacterized protein n=1 Tax=Leersia perrieri TaxID=77586 RepID=A0A0D9V8K7_9ORYZ